jgi:hypothetical protein
MPDESVLGQYPVRYPAISPIVPDPSARMRMRLSFGSSVMRWTTHWSFGDGMDSSTKLASER